MQTPKSFLLLLLSQSLAVHHVIGDMNDPSTYRGSVFPCATGQSGYCGLEIKQQAIFYMLYARKSTKPPITFDCNEQSGTTPYCCNDKKFSYTDPKKNITSTTIVKNTCSIGKKSQN
ncbi:uncharacterized protein PGTG_03645 [Puccinia graminis f. sp. tritici CRL 75-36-700-3]|uniref:Hydrophobin n=1 Tax=Puccinia graminis f. sp. tritici (strain CRL 75-36-700-3 / race SCCL) TaxID=418459 RepID=E3K064_PUCGT|nr:uncharacterized protein PGTG_03645 [Puccinia graminis f. sp. tritici CRL 75-36-700-3]EFP77689.1 hypothetical protein PGTG_03645 [Puccinia graminis f. sp. tritici CRL 75-36-700-3]